MEGNCNECIESDTETYENEAKEEGNSPPISIEKPIMKLGGFDFFRQVLKSPKFVAAPMVDQSELAFRLLCRRYNTELCYTPMFHSKNFVTEKKYRKKQFTTCPEDRPLIVQFCANDPHYLLQAAKLVEDQCDAVDINFGCPQRIARTGNYGAFLMENWPLVHNLVKTLHDNLKVPVTCKIRIFPEYEKTLQYAKMIESAGCQLLVVHGRTRDMKGHKVGLADWEVIRKLKEELSIPVISNGNIRHLNDVTDCLKVTRADGVMSAEGILKNPALFSGKKIDCFQLAYEYLDICEKYPPPDVFVKSHICKILVDYLAEHHVLRDKMYQTRGLEKTRESVREIELAVKGNKIPQPEVKPKREKWEADVEDTFSQSLFQ